MANTQYQYVKDFEREEVLLGNTWIVVRIDGRGFHKFSTKYEFEKPNDRRALDLMNAAAQAVMRELSDLVLAYGISDEYSFIFHKDTSLFQRRSSKIMTTVVSTFTAYYVSLWPTHFPDKALTSPMPTFDGRCVCYPSVRNLRDYMSWRQADCHINNLFNTTFWALIQRGGLTNKEAEQKLSGTLSRDKNELLFSLGINYDKEPPIYKKGTTLYRDYELQDPLQDSTAISEHVAAAAEEEEEEDTQESSLSPCLKMSKTALQRERKKKAKAGIAVWHGDIIQDGFWQRRSWILSGRAGSLKSEADGPRENGSLERKSGPESLVVANGSDVEHAAQGLV